MTPGDMREKAREANITAAGALEAVKKHAADREMVAMLGQQAASTALLSVTWRIGAAHLEVLWKILAELKGESK